MGQRSSQQDSDGITWQTVAIALGTAGLDLRTPIDLSALNELLNAHFIDGRTVSQRNGHDALDIHDGSNIALAGPGLHPTGDWVFGHGAVVAP